MKPKFKAAFLSDVHGNSPALKAVLQDINRHEVDELVMLGDLVAGVDPAGCVALLRDWEASTDRKLTCIAGNSEAWLLTPDRDSLRSYGIPFIIPPLVEIIEWWENHLSADDLLWLRTWPVSLRWQHSLLVHDSPLDRIAVEIESNPVLIAEHREWFFHGIGINIDFSEEELAPHFDWMKQNDCERIFCGHTHNAFIRECEGKIICNAGSAGAPTDEDWRPAWVLLEEGYSEGASITIHRVEYDLTSIYKLFEINQDYPHFQVRPNMIEDFKQWYATGHHW